MLRYSLPVLLLSALGSTALPQDVEKRVGQLRIKVDLSRAVPGGLLDVHLNTSLGTTFALLNGTRVTFEAGPHGPRALVPVSLTTPPGPAVLGIELVARRGSQRVPVDVTISPRVYPARVMLIPPEKQALLDDRSSTRQSRILLENLRTLTDKAEWKGPFKPPVSVPATSSFGRPDTFTGAANVDFRMDSIFGEDHRGLDYPVPPGIPVLAPGAGTVVLAQSLVLTGETLVIDHGQGIVSAFFHLGRIDVQEGTRVEGQAPIGVSGETGLTTFPHVHWGTYLHGVAVDPTLLGEALGE
jgi:murein DD-endopeptidase MepM/ murein hydrolase activator NlpD